jgi:hypothetical protein
MSSKTKLNSDRVTQVSRVTFRQNIVTCIPIARQRLGKQIPAEVNARNSRTSIARQRISKHVSLTVESVFSAYPCTVAEAGRSSIELVVVKNWVWKSKVIEKK